MQIVCLFGLATIGVFVYCVLKCDVVVIAVAGVITDTPSFTPSHLAAR